MPKRVLDVGNCDMDHGNIRGMLMDQFQADVQRAHFANEALEAVKKGGIDLVLVNRQFDADDSYGIDFIKLLKRTPETAHVPVMLITNFPEHQEAALKEGALPGFGKRAIHAAETREKIAQVLE